MNAVNAAVAFSALFSLSAQAAEPLARYEYQAGFSPTPGGESITIDDSGRVQFKSRYLNRDGGREIRKDLTLGILNRTAVAALKRSLGKIKADDLVDQQAGEPLCADAPSSQFSVITAGNETMIGGSAGCHHYQNDKPEAKNIRTILEGFVALSKISPY